MLKLKWTHSTVDPNGFEYLQVTEKLTTFFSQWQKFFSQWQKGMMAKVGGDDPIGVRTSKVGDASGIPYGGCAYVHDLNGGVYAGLLVRFLCGA